MDLIQLYISNTLMWFNALCFSGQVFDANIPLSEHLSLKIKNAHLEGRATYLSVGNKQVICGTKQITDQHIY